MREVVNGIRYVNRGGCAWRALLRVVERTFAWLGRRRRLSKDCEETTGSSEAMTCVATIGVMVRRPAS